MNLLHNEDSFSNGLETKLNYKTYLKADWYPHASNEPVRRRSVGVFYDLIAGLFCLITRLNHQSRRDAFDSYCSSVGYMYNCSI